jgi:ribonuclease BN (tRNA processing enzyme)
MQVLPIGVGTAFGRRLFNTNLIFEFDSGDFMLVDCGITASRSLETIGRSVLDVENLFISHLHADHIGGVEELALKAKLIKRRKINLHINRKLVDSFWQSIRAGIEFTQMGQLDLDDYFAVHLHDNEFNLNGVNFSTCATQHIAGMLSFDLAFADFLLTGDTLFSEEYVRGRAQAFKTVVHDCSFNSHQKVHTHYEDLLQNRRLFQELYVIHYEDYIAKYEQRLQSADIGICRQYRSIESLAAVRRRSQDAGRTQ